MSEHAVDVITIRLNGNTTPVNRGTTISGLLEEKGLKPLLVVVEINGEIVARASFSERVFESGDQVEIVHFVGGGEEFPG